MDGIDHLIPAHHRAVAKTDQPHSYRCPGEKRTRFSMVVHERGSTRLHIRGDRGSGTFLGHFDRDVM